MHALITGADTPHSTPGRRRSLVNTVRGRPFKITFYVLALKNTMTMKHLGVCYPPHFVNAFLLFDSRISALLKQAPAAYAQ